MKFMEALIICSVQVVEILQQTIFSQMLIMKKCLVKTCLNAKNAKII